MEEGGARARGGINIKETPSFYRGALFPQNKKRPRNTVIKRCILAVSSSADYSIDI